MRQVIKTVYTYDELSDEAKENARNWFREGQDFESDFVMDDAKQIAELFGLDIKNIYYSGFWSQGDGASFNGYYSYKKGALKAIKDYAPKDTELHKIVAQLQELQRRNFYRITANIKQSGNYCHEMTMSCDSENDDLIESLRAYAKWIYRSLEKEYEYQFSDDAIADSILANEYEFNENGEYAK